MYKNTSNGCKVRVKAVQTHDFSPAFSSVISSRLEDLLTVCRICSVTSDPFGVQQV